jgi:uncharacterized protein
MTQDFVQVSFDRIIQTPAYTAIVLKNNEQRFAIYAEESVGRFLQSHLTGEERPRPLTPDLFSSVLNTYKIRVKQVLITDLVDTLFYARIFFEMDQGELCHIIEVDARPSDCIILSFLHNVPVFCSAQVLQKAIPFAE